MLYVCFSFHIYYVLINTLLYSCFVEIANRRRGLAGGGGGSGGNLAQMGRKTVIVISTWRLLPGRHTRGIYLFTRRSLNYVVLRIEQRIRACIKYA